MTIFQSVSKRECFAYNREKDSLATATIFWTKPNPCQKLKILSDFASGWLLRCCDIRADFSARFCPKRVSYEIIRVSFGLYSCELWNYSWQFCVVFVAVMGRKPVLYEVKFLFFTCEKSWFFIHFNTDSLRSPVFIRVKRCVWSGVWRF